MLVDQESGFRANLGVVNASPKVLSAIVEVFTADGQPGSGLCSHPVVVVTGITSGHSDLQAFVRTFLELDHLPVPDAYLKKPVEPGDLLHAVHDSLRVV